MSESLDVLNQRNDTVASQAAEDYDGGVGPAQARLAADAISAQLGQRILQQCRWHQIRLGAELKRERNGEKRETTSWGWIPSNLSVFLFLSSLFLFLSFLGSFLSRRDNEPHQEHAIEAALGRHACVRHQ